jgi:hypothetical protein
MTPTVGTASTASFCANGDQLHLSEMTMDMSAGMMGTTTTTVEVVASKQ